MNRNSSMPLQPIVIASLTAAVAVLSFYPTKASGAPKGKRPNIIYILVDDMGYGDLGCYGQKLIKTPNLDRMAAEGIRFTNHYSGSTVSAPSRCSLMTGFHTGHSVVRGNKEYPGGEGQMPMPAETVTVASLLRSVGYATGLVGKWGLGYPGSDSDPLKMGFNYFYGYNCQRQAHSYYPEYLWENDKQVILPGNGAGQQAIYSHDLLTQKAEQFITERKDSTFFLYLAYTIPHAELVIPDQYLERYKGLFPETPFSGGHYGSQTAPHAAYAAMVSHMDEDLGKLFGLLKEFNLDENTLIMFASDNGPHVEGGNDPAFFNSSGGLRGVKRDLYEGGIRTAFIAKWPRTIQAGRTSDHISAFWDVLPTLCEVAGVDSNQNSDGISFLPELLGKQQPKHHYLYWEFNEGEKKQALRMGDWKAVRFLKPEGAVTELYHLGRDLSEEQNVAKKQPAVVRKMELLMKQVHTEPAEE